MPANLEVKRILDMSQFKDYFKLKCDHNAILWSGVASAPKEEVLKDYFKKLLNSNKIGLLFYHDGRIIGYCQLSESGSFLEVDGYSVLSDMSGLGYGKEIIKYISSNHMSEGINKIKQHKRGGGNCLGIRA